MGIQLMDFDEKNIINIDINEIFNFLIDSNCYPVIETDLLRNFFPDYEEVMLSGISLDTFKMHFVLYHHLFKLARKLILEKNEYFLFIKYIYIYLLKRPEKNKCQFFNEELESFCGEKVYGTNGKNFKYCKYHHDIEKKKKNQLDFIDISHYYLDFNNYYKMNEKELEKTIGGMYRYVKDKDIIEESFDILSVSIDDPFKRIHDRFIYLSKKFHPDVNKETFSEEKYKKISRAYHILKDFFNK